MVATDHGVLPRFNARPIDRTQVSLMLLPVIACAADCAATHGSLRARFSPRPIRFGLPLSRRQKERKKCEAYSVSETIEKAPSLSLPKNERAYALKNLIFYKVSCNIFIITTFRRVNPFIYMTTFYKIVKFRLGFRQLIYNVKFYFHSFRYNGFYIN